MQSELKPCPFCGGEAAFEQTGRQELTLRCVGVQPSGLRGCGPKYVQKWLRFSKEWLIEHMTEKWNRRFLVQERNPDEITNLARSIVTAACELDGPADPQHEDTICISYRDLDAIIYRHLACYDERIRSALVDVPVEPDQRLYDGTKPMADGGDTTMTAAEEVLAWLLIEKIGVPDDVPYSPDQAQEIIVRQLSAPPHREGEDSAEVEQIVGSHEIIDFLYKHGDLTYSAAARAVQLLTGNGYGFTSSSEARKESLLTMRKALNKIADMIDAEDADLDDAISIATTALAATRSGSATDQKGGAE